MVTDLMPASSPTWMSTVSNFKSERSIHRVYMRMSMSAQSQDSVPPAPEWMVKKVGLWSNSPESN